MLVLSRKIGEQILMPQCEISVTILAIKGKTVRLGITAPDHIDITRSEIARSEILHQVRASAHRPPVKG